MKSMPASSNQKSILGFLLLLLIVCSLLIGSAGSEEEQRTAARSRRKRYVVFPEGSSFSIALCLTVHTLTPDSIFTEGINWGVSYDLPNESKPELDPFLSQRRKDNLPPLKKPPSTSSKYKNNPGYYYSPYKPPKAVAEADDNSVSSSSGGGWNDKVKSKFKSKKYTKADYHYLQRRYRRDLYAKMETAINAMGFDGRSCVLRALCEASQKLMPKGNSLVEEMIRIVFSLPLKRLFNFEPAEHHVYAGAHRAGHEGEDCPARYPECGFSLLDMALGKYDATAPSAPTPATGYYDNADDYLYYYTTGGGGANRLPAYLRYTMK